MRSTVLLLRPGYLREFAIKTFLERGVRLAILDEPWNPFMRFADFPLYADPRDYELSIRQVRRLCQRIQIGGVITFDDRALVTGARIAKELSLPFASAESVESARSKDVMRSRLAAEGVPIPNFRVVRSAREGQRAAQEIGFPVIVKPTNLNASIGVTRVDAPAGVAEAYAAASRVSGEATALVEEHVRGPEVSVETITTGGTTSVLAITDKKLASENCFIEMGHVVPASLSDHAAQEISQVVRSAISALGLDLTFTHTEVRLPPDGPKIIEVNSRLAGGCIVNLVHLASGTNLYELALDLATGGACRPTTPVFQRHAGIHFFSSAPGRLKSIRLAPELLAHDGLAAVSMQYRPGDMLPPMQFNLMRRGYVILVRESRPALERDLDMLDERVTFAVETKVTSAG